MPYFFARTSPTSNAGLKRSGRGIAAQLPIDQAMAEANKLVERHAIFLASTQAFMVHSNHSLLEKRTPADQSASNASSIALLLNYGEKRILLSGDAHADVIYEALEKSWPGRKLQIDLLKISHHGSQANTSTSLLSRIQCKRFAFSTNGKIHSHRDQIAIARVIASIYNPKLIFNYANMWTNRWRNRPALWPVYLTVYPNTDVPYVRVIV